jgi:uncharacterized protein YceK
MRQVWLVGLSAALLSGCASVVEGSTQQIAVNTTPAGASCILNRDGSPIAKINSTPGSVMVSKSKYDIEVICELDGFQKTARLDESGTAAAVFGNILVGGAIGLVIDMSSGASNKYDSALDIALAPRPDISLPAPLAIVASTPLVPPSPPPAAAMLDHPAPAAPAAPSAAVTVDLRRAENAAERYRLLRQLVSDGLVPQDRYVAWAQQNAGAFLVTTQAPPFAGVGNKAPSYQELSGFLRSIGTEKNAKVAEAEHEALFVALMPMEGKRDQPRKPPADADALRNWYLFLDRVRDEGLVSPESIEAEKAALDEARPVAAIQ